MVGRLEIDATAAAAMIGDFRSYPRPEPAYPSFSDQGPRP
jgi:hypothetical protein